MSETGHGFKYFSGDDCDHREYRRWKQWCLNKMAVMDKLPKEARGSFVWTLLQGRALEIVEHLKEEEYQKEGGDVVIFDLLDRRWPQKDRTDEIGEHVSEVFHLKAAEGETVRTWCARARECFDRCHRKTGVIFPDEARGWLLLNCSGMTAEQRADVLARTQGALKFDELAQAMRSCFPEFVVPRKRSAAAHYLENEEEVWWPEEAEAAGDDEDEATGFHDVEQFLAEHGEAEIEQEMYQEAEVAEVLAATWKDRRQELARLQKARKFHQAGEVKRAFRVEVEELKKKTKCHRCGRVGHWARECRLPRNQDRDRQGSTASASGAGYVESTSHFVCYAEVGRVRMLEKLRSKQAAIPHEIFLVSSPGYAVLDSGCGRSIVGEHTLQAFRALWRENGVTQPKELPEMNSFRFGNGEQETSQVAVEMPIHLAGKDGFVKAAVIRGHAPLLMSRTALKKLKATMDFDRDELHLFDDNLKIPMEVNEAGQYMIPVVLSHVKTSGAAVVQEEKTASAGDGNTVDSGTAVTTDDQGTLVDFWQYEEAIGRVVRVHVEPRTTLFTPSGSQCPVSLSRLTPERTTTYTYLGEDVLQEHQDSWKDSRTAHANVGTRAWVGRTVFQVAGQPAEPPESAVALSAWTPHQFRQVRSGLKQALQDSPGLSADRPHIIEVFSPPRFALQAATKGLRCVSADLQTGWDFRRPQDRDAMTQLVQASPPDLLVLCPPCTWAGGWYHLNRCYLSPEERRQKELTTRLFLNFSASLAQIQLASGGRVMFEHPFSSSAWQLPQMQRLREKMFEVSVDMCAYGLKVPDGRSIRKHTRLLVSHANMRSLTRRCPGPAVHSEHHPVAGSCPGIGSVSRFAGQYTAAFVRAVLRTVKELPASVCLIQSVSDHECLVASRVAELNDQQKEAMAASIRKLHVNLGPVSYTHLRAHET